LAKEIQFLLADNPTSDGYRIERRCHFFGNVIRFGDFAGDMPVRLFRRDGHVRPETDRFDVENVAKQTGKLRCTIEYCIWAIEQTIAPLSQSANAAAEESQARGRQPSFASVLFHAPLRFLRSYFLKLGFLDGLAGLYLAIWSSTFVYIRYAKLRRVQRGLPHPDNLVDPKACRTIGEQSIEARRKVA
jgi:hypothetical protein